MRALSSLLLAGAVGIGGLVLAPAAAEADGGWRGRDYYRYYTPPAPSYYGYGYGPPAGYYRPLPRVYYGAPPGFYRPPPPAYFPAPGAVYGAPRGFYGAPRSYGIPPGPGVGLFIR
jgi:hypothetical protein